MSGRTINPPDAAAPVGLYSHGVVSSGAGQWLHISGQIGMRPDGSLASGFVEQARVAWSNLVAVLKAAGMDVSDLVKVTTFMTDAGDLKDFGPVRSAFLGEARPASTLLIVNALARPEWLIEVEAIAHRG